MRQQQGESQQEQSVDRTKQQVDSRETQRSRLAGELQQRLLSVQAVPALKQAHTEENIKISCYALVCWRQALDCLTDV